MLSLPEGDQIILKEIWRKKLTLLDEITVIYIVYYYVSTRQPRACPRTQVVKLIFCYRNCSKNFEMSIGRLSVPRKLMKGSISLMQLVCLIKSIYLNRFLNYDDKWALDTMLIEVFHKFLMYTIRKIC